MTLTNSHRIEVEFGDCDPAGIVFYPNYFRYFDAATVRLFERALGMKKATLLVRFGIAGIPMVDTGAKFIAPSHFGDTVEIVSSIASFGRSSFRVEHRLSNAGVLSVEAHEVRVWVGRDAGDPTTLKALTIPDEVRAAFDRETPHG